MTSSLPLNTKVRVIDRQLRHATGHSVVHARIHHMAVFSQLSQTGRGRNAARIEQFREIKQELLPGHSSIAREARVNQGVWIGGCEFRSDKGVTPAIPKAAAVGLANHRNVYVNVPYPSWSNLPLFGS